MFKFKKSKVMKTKVEELKYEDVLSMKKDEVATVIEKTFNGAIKRKVAKMDWEITEDLPSHAEIVKRLERLDLASHKQYKKLCRGLVRINRRTTMRPINIFFNKLGCGCRVKIGKKEEAIQTKRKEWLELRDKAEAALLKYKEEKGDFYKVRLN